MSEVKNLIIKPIKAEIARVFVAKNHYSGKTVQNSILHFGVFMNGVLGGVMQYGSPIDKRKVIGLVEGTKRNGFLELNRMAFADWLPKNSESRALAVSFRLIKKHYPHIEWILSFADGTQCGGRHDLSGFGLPAYPDQPQQNDLGSTKWNEAQRLGASPEQNYFDQRQTSWIDRRSFKHEAVHRNGIQATGRIPTSVYSIS